MKVSGNMWFFKIVNWKKKTYKRLTRKEYKGEKEKIQGKKVGRKVVKEAASLFQIGC